jgi:hypothetical protein
MVQKESPQADSHPWGSPEDIMKIPGGTLITLIII